MLVLVSTFFVIFSHLKKYCLFKACIKIYVWKYT
uniref:Macaca fascicularis brain cDNA clone: QbsA-10917, similar to human abl-interactor 1 (ABI1), mRNA, RefSeq: NM_005470.1 n=1 Tax=Macaca fascicularis TaxID=9541 RepID=I7GKB8_MACFA|nr:unnamed protein product [Macaca fascicularis]